MLEYFPLSGAMWLQLNTTTLWELLKKTFGHNKNIPGCFQTARNRSGTRTHKQPVQVPSRSKPFNDKAGKWLNTVFILDDVPT